MKDFEKKRTLKNQGRMGKRGRKGLKETKLQKKGPRKVLFWRRSSEEKTEREDAKYFIKKPTRTKGGRKKIPGTVKGLQKKKDQNVRGKNEVIQREHTRQRN